MAIDKKHISWGKLGFLFFAIIPSLIVLGYYAFYASPVYVCESSFAVMQPQSASSPEMDMLQSLQGGGNANNDVYILAEYIRSSELLKSLEAKHNIRGHYSDESIDKFSRLDKDASWISFKSYIKDRIRTDINWDANIVNLSVYTYKPDICTRISNSIIELSEVFVNNLSNEIHEDFKDFANQQLQEAEENMKKAGGLVTEYRKENDMFDPGQEAQSVLSIIGSLEAEYSKTQVELSEKLQIHKPGSPVIEGLQTRLSALNQQIRDERRKLASQSGNALSEELQEFEGILLQQEFAKSRYQLALSLWEVVQTEALQRTKYLITIQKPLIPDVNDWFFQTQKALAIAGTILIVYLVISLVLMAIKDHMEG